jgi:hypothetical protein
VLRASIRVTPPEGEGPVELVLGSLLPDGLITYVGADRRPTHPSRRGSPIPLAVIAPGLPRGDAALTVELPIPADAPQGPYEVFALLLRPRVGACPATFADVLALDTTALFLIESRP